jgi:hypothetical protein
MSHFFRVCEDMTDMGPRRQYIWVTLVLADKYTSNDSRDLSVKCPLPNQMGYR